MRYVKESDWVFLYVNSICISKVPKSLKESLKEYGGVCINNRMYVRVNKEYGYYVRINDKVVDSVVFNAINRAPVYYIDNDKMISDGHAFVDVTDRRPILFLE